MAALTANAFADDGLLEWQDNNAYFLSLRRNEGSTVGDKLSYTTLEALAFPFNHQYFMPFFDLRAHGFGENKQNAANIGLGFRIMPSCTDYIFGANVYYDFRKVHRLFNQVGIGVEILGPIFNFRINGYLPVGKKTFFHSSKHVANYSEGRYLIREKFTDSLKGINFEAEALLAKICCRDIYLAIGGYYYQGMKCRGNILGSEYRLTVKPFDFVTVSVTATHDSLFKTRIQGQIVITFPFKKLDEYEINTLFQPVRRHELIVLDKHSMWLWNW